MADRTLIPATEAQALEWHRTGTIALCQCGAMEDETRPCPCPDACHVPESERDPELTRIVWGTYAALILSILGAVFWPH